MMYRSGVVIQGHKDQRVSCLVDGSQSLGVERVHKGVACLDETCEVLVNVVALHALKGLIGKVAAHGTPLVSVFFYILPVNPRRGHDVADVIDEFLHEAEVATYSGATAAYFTHP